MIKLTSDDTLKDGTQDKTRIYERRGRPAT